MMMLPNTAIVEGRWNAKQAILSKSAPVGGEPVGGATAGMAQICARLCAKKARQIILKMTLQFSRP
jgi:hypothetical protein